MTNLNNAQQLKNIEIKNIKEIFEDGLLDQDEINNIENRLFSEEESNWMNNISEDSQEWQDVRDMQHDVINFAQELLNS